MTLRRKFPATAAMILPLVLWTAPAALADDTVVSAPPDEPSVSLQATPTKPSNLAAPASDVSGSGTFALTWTASQPAVDSYEIQRGVPGGTYSLIGTAEGTAYDIIANGDGTFNFRVRACNGSGCSDYADPVTVRVLQAPLAPTNLHAEGLEQNNGRFVIAWTASAQGSVGTYDLQSRDGSGPWVTQTLPSTTTQSPQRRAHSGPYSYRVRACNGGGCSAWAPLWPAVLTLNVVVQLDNLVADGEVVHLPVPAQANIGTIQGEASVQGGGADYSMRIEVPPGRMGMEPAIALSYNSKSDNGAPGVGWSVDAGATAIYRCPRTVAQDGATRAIDFSLEDKLCFNGTRLVVVGGTYGRDGSEYRTEINSFARIKLTGDISDPASVFSVEEKSGNVSQLGGGGPFGGAYVPEGVNAPMTWKVMRVTDAQDNTMNYQYVTMLGEHLLAHIDYTGTKQSAGDRRVLFDYSGGRTDERTVYQGGAKLPRTALLTGIETYVGQERVKYYDLSYTTSGATGRHLLQGVRVCADTPCINHLPPTVFQYNQSAVSFEARQLVPNPPIDAFHADVWQLEDLDGDGTQDSMYLEWPPSWGASSKTELRLSSQPDAPVNITTTPWLKGFDRIGDGDPARRDTDLNRDGLADLVGTVAGQLSIGGLDTGTPPSVAMRKTSNLSVPDGTTILEIADYDADGDNDVLFGRLDGENYKLSWQENRSVRSASTLEFGASVLAATLVQREQMETIADFDGNGLPDILIGSHNPSDTDTPTRIVFSKWQGTSVVFESKLLRDIGGPTLPVAVLNGAGFIDFNGDGLPDLYQLPGHFWVNTGGQFQALADLGDPLGLDYRLYRSALVMDFDADGSQDLLIPRGAPLAVYCYLTQSSTPGEWDERCDKDIVPESENHSIYMWDAIRIRLHSDGTPSLERVQTNLKAPVYRSQVEDYYGDGLPDVRYQVSPAWGDNSSGGIWVVGEYRGGLAGLSPGTSIARNLGGDTPHPGVRPDSLKQATNGLGLSTRWEYSPLSSENPTCQKNAPQKYPFYHVDRAAALPDAFHFASAMQVVSRFTTDDGRGGERATCYRYEDAMYSRTGRGFLGFRKIHEEDTTQDGNQQANLRTSTSYYAEFPLTGTPSVVRTELAAEPLGSTPISEITAAWDYSQAASIWTVFQAQSVEKEYHLAKNGTGIRPLRSKQSTTYIRNAADQAHGNVTETWAVLDDANATYVRHTTNDYDYADEGAWWINKLRSQVNTSEPAVIKQAPFPDPVLNLRKSTTQTNEWYPLGHVSQRLMRKTKFQEGVARQQIVTTFTYDVYGNPKSTTGEADGMAEPRTETLQYTSDGYFPQTQTNALGQATELEAQPATGNLKKQKSFGIAAEATYDPYGRLLQITKPDQPPIYTRVVACDSSCPPFGVYRQVTIQDGSPVRSQTFDRLGRGIENRETGFAGTDIVTVSVYDGRGRLLGESVPVEASSSTQYFTQYGDYDALGRVGRKTVERTGENAQPLVTTYAYECPDVPVSPGNEPGCRLETRIGLPGGLTANRIHDAAGRVLETTDAKSGRTISRYDGSGALILLQDAAGANITFEYDDVGRRTKTTDPNRGTVSFEYDGLGEQTAEVTSLGTRIDLQYDGMGRLRKRLVGGALEAEYAYDAAKPGLMDSESGPGFVRRYDYDSLRRLKVTTTEVDGLSFRTEQAYDSYYGRPKALLYPSGEAVGRRFNAYGYGTEQFDPLAPGQDFTYVTQLGMTPRGQVSSMLYGNGLKSTYSYFASTGQVESIKTRPNATSPVMLQRLEYAYADPFMNLTTQTNVLKNVSETFAYDELQRLKKTTRARPGGVEVIDYTYDALGNFKKKSDFAQLYEYGSVSHQNAANAGPNAVSSVTRPDGNVISDFNYDAAGNMLVGLGRTVQFNAYNQPTSVASSGVVTTFAYAPDHEKYKQVTGSRTTYYIQGAYEYVVDGSAQESTTYVGSDLIIHAVGTTRQVRYVHRDRLGSIDTITDESGAVVEAHGFDPFGKPLTSAWLDTGGKLHSGEFTEKTTNRGFTDHVHLDDHGLIHMVGRVYDPSLGRFLSPDPIVQDRSNSQTLNPYGYVLNYPLSGVDPTGFICVGRNGLPCDQGGDLPLPDGETVRGVHANGKSEQGGDVAPAGPKQVQLQQMPAGWDVVKGSESYIEKNDVSSVDQNGKQAQYLDTVNIANEAGEEMTVSRYTHAVVNPAYQTTVVGSREVGIGAPSTLESFIPVWGPSRAAINDFQNGRWLRGAFNAVMAVTDVFMVKAVVSGLARGGIAAAGRFFWDPRNFKRISAEYWAEHGPANGASLGHIFFPQRWGWVPQGLRNAGFNLMRLPGWPTIKGLALNTYMGFAARWSIGHRVAAFGMDWALRVGVGAYGYGRCTTVDDE